MKAFKREILWSVHNLLAHPVSELCYWLRFIKPVYRTGCTTRLSPNMSWAPVAVNGEKAGAFEINAAAVN